MPSPVVPSELLSLLPSPTATQCDAFLKALIAFPLRVYQIFNWMFDSSGNLTAAFFNIARKPGTLVASFVSLNESTDFVLLCDGRAVSRTTYASLFAAIGTTYGVGDGSTTFNIPDVQTRALVATGSRVATGDDPALTYTLGQKLGEAYHKLITAEIPSHTHAIAANLYTTGLSGSADSKPDAGGPQVSGATGGGQVHENRQPSFAIHCYIAT